MQLYHIHWLKHGLSIQRSPYTSNAYSLGSQICLGNTVAIIYLTGTCTRKKSRRIDFDRLPCQWQTCGVRVLVLNSERIEGMPTGIPVYLHQRKQQSTCKATLETSKGGSICIYNITGKQLHAQGKWMGRSLALTMFSIPLVMKQLKESLCSFTRPLTYGFNQPDIHMCQRKGIDVN